MLYTTVMFVLALGVLVIVHEWGHYIVAKLSGVWVEKFSIGFGPKILGFSKNGTDYRVAPIPLGGYVKLYGQDPWEEAEGDPVRAEEIARDPRAFHSKPMSRKLATVLAGPAMNLVLCALILPIVFMVGRLQPKFLDEKPVVVDVEEGSPAAQIGLVKGDLILSVNDNTVATWKDLITQVSVYPDKTVPLVYSRDGQTVSKEVRIVQDKSKKQISGFLGIEPFSYFGNTPVIDEVKANSPAAKAGLKSGDHVLSVAATPIKYWTQMTAEIQKQAGQSYEIIVERGAEKLTLGAQSEYNSDAGMWLLGITKKIEDGLMVKKRYGPGQALVLGVKEFGKLWNLTIDVLGRLFTGDLSYKTLGGPIQIAKASSMAAKSGLGEFLYLLAFLSLQLGVMNLLPVPVLDGGHVVFMFVELLRRKPISPKIRQISTQLGMLMLLSLMLVVTINDIDSVWGFTNILDSLKSLF